MLKKLRHIGIMVDDFEQALEKFKGFGLTCSETKEDKRIDLLDGFLVHRRDFDRAPSPHQTG